MHDSTTAMLTEPLWTTYTSGAMSQNILYSVKLRDVATGVRKVTDVIVKLKLDGKTKSCSSVAQ